MPEGSAKITPKEVADHILEKIDEIVQGRKLEAVTHTANADYYMKEATVNLKMYVEALDAVTRYAAESGYRTDYPSASKSTVLNSLPG